MIDLAQFEKIITALGKQASDDIAWSESIAPPASPEDFALETIFVICNSGMKNTVARAIYERVRDALRDGKSAGTAFGHKGKASAIDKIWQERSVLFADFQDAQDKLVYLASLPWIGDITKYHLAKNFGADVAKPDVHLQRLANVHRTTPHALCAALAGKTGYRVATVDTLLWRACANGILNSTTGVLT